MFVATTALKTGAAKTQRISQWVFVGPIHRQHPALRRSSNMDAVEMAYQRSKQIEENTQKPKLREPHASDNELRKRRGIRQQLSKLWR